MNGPLPNAVLRAMPPGLFEVYSAVLDLHEMIRRSIGASLREAAGFSLAGVSHEGEPGGDRSFKLDVPGEAAITRFFRRRSDLWPIVVVAEGLGRRVFPPGGAEGDARWLAIIDPVDGTRELMYEKRSAWILTGIAPNRRGATLADIVLSVQTELAPPIQAGWRQAAAVAGSGSSWEVVHRGRHEQAIQLRASGESSARGGWVSFVDLFPGASATIGRISDATFEGVFGPPGATEAQVFFDQYCSTGGQVHQLASGRYRMVADIRGDLARRGSTTGLCAKPYDLCTWVIASEAGGKISRPGPARLDYPLDTTTNCSWVGYANADVESEIDAEFQRALSADSSWRGVRP